jgi:pyruvoyl-dependent arginine decarboxylase (PvlArgDC)
MAVYLMCIYMDKSEEEFRKAWLKTGKKLDMGKSCIRFKKLEDVALDVIADVIRNISAQGYVAKYQEVLQRNAANKPAKKSAASATKKAARKVLKKNTTSAKAAPKKARKKMIRLTALPFK